MIDPGDYYDAIEHIRSTLHILRGADMAELTEVRMAICDITGVIDGLRDLQDELVEAEGLLDPDGWYTG